VSINLLFLKFLPLLSQNALFLRSQSANRTTQTYVSTSTSGLPRTTFSPTSIIVTVANPQWVRVRVRVRVRLGLGLGLG